MPFSGANLALLSQVSSFTIGLIFSIGGIGAVLGSVVATSFQKRFSFSQVIIGTTWIAALILPLYTIAPNPLVLGALAAIDFIVGPVYNVVQFSYRSSVIPDELQGRVNSVFRLIAFGGQPLGLALTGVLIQNIGAIKTVFICAFGMASLALAATLNKHVRKSNNNQYGIEHFRASRKQPPLCPIGPPLFKYYMLRCPTYKVPNPRPGGFRYAFSLTQRYPRLLVW